MSKLHLVGIGGVVMVCPICHDRNETPPSDNSLDSFNAWLDAFEERHHMCADDGTGGDAIDVKKHEHNMELIATVREQVQELARLEAVRDRLAQELEEDRKASSDLRVEHAAARLQLDRASTQNIQLRQAIEELKAANYGFGQQSDERGKELARMDHSQHEAASKAARLAFELHEEQARTAGLREALDEKTKTAKEIEKMRDLAQNRLNDAKLELVQKDHHIAALTAERDQARRRLPKPEEREASLMRQRDDAQDLVQKMRGERDEMAARLRLAGIDCI